MAPLETILTISTAILTISTALCASAAAFLAHTLSKTTKDLEEANAEIKTQKEELDLKRTELETAATKNLTQSLEQSSQIKLLQKEIENERYHTNEAKKQIEKNKTQEEKTKEEFDRTIKLALQTFSNKATQTFDATLSKKVEIFNTEQKTSLEPLNKDLTEFKKKIEELQNQHNNTKTELTTSIKHLISQTNSIGEEAKKLTNALSKNKQVGIWGEMVLDRILSGSGFINGQDYHMEESTKDESGRNKRPDCTINLPEGRKLIIDAKTSLDAYTKLEGDSHLTEEERKNYIQKHIASINTHIANLKSKEYHKSVDNSLDVVCMFIPIEGAFMLAVEESLKQGKDIFNEAFKKGIFIVTPSTMMLTIHLIKKFWEAEKQKENIQKVIKLANRAYQKAVASTTNFEKIGEHLGKAQREYESGFNQIYKGADSMVGALKNIEEMKDLGYVTETNHNIKTLPVYKAASVEREINQSATIINQTPNKPEDKSEEDETTPKNTTEDGGLL